VIHRGWPLLVALALAGCDLIPYEGGDDGYAPRITSSFPDSGTQRLLLDGTLEFAAAGVDDDSLELTWSWRLDDEVQAVGTFTDGTFDVAWELVWTEDLSGASVDVCFEVSDGSLTSELFWPVDVD